jgi:hypothetical protein
MGAVTVYPTARAGTAAPPMDCRMAHRPATEGNGWLSRARCGYETPAVGSERPIVL